jgi:tRNA threonylcarbamoyladenosine modification (KEOPS) complex  Pcc1 subunit
MERDDPTIPVYTEITIDMPGDLVGVIEGSLVPEVEHPTSERSNVEVVAGEGKLVIRIKASDVAALRAAINSYLRWVSAILDVVDSIE